MAVDDAFKTEMVEMLSRSNHEYFVRRGQNRYKWEDLPESVKFLQREAQLEILQPLFDVLEASNKLELASLQFQIEMLAAEMDNALLDAEAGRFWAKRLRALLPKPAQPQGD